jgi:K+-sensing histidine kinase KdpD
MVANDLRDTTQHILDLATHLTGAENGSLMLLNGHGELYILNSRGLTGAIMNVARNKIGEGVSGQVVEDGSPVLIEDISSDERFSSFQRSRYRTGSFIVCPITTSEQVIGVLNLNDKESGQPFSHEDLDHAKRVSLMAAVALRNYFGRNSLKHGNVDVDALYHKFVEAECNNREFIARISHDLKTPLNNIKGSVYYLKSSTGIDHGKELEFFEIIEKEVNYLISYLDNGLRDYEKMQERLADIEERQRYRKLLQQ